LTPDAERQRVAGWEPGRSGGRSLPNEIDFLLARGYPLKRTDARSIAEAVSAYLADSVMEGAWATN
jgi:hypothetical protein